LGSHYDSHTHLKWLKARLMSALLNFQSFLVCILLFICTSTYLRAQLPSYIRRDKEGFAAFAYKGSVIGTRLSPWVSLSCMVMAVFVLLF